ncbi:MAG: asparagine synthase-related protein [Acidobacteriota bacterium]
MAFASASSGAVSSGTTREASGVVITSSARLDYRDELCGDLGINASDARPLSDDDLVGAAYAKWGRQSTAHLFGDWSFAAWDEHQRSLFLARDHIGNTGLFYVHRPPLFAFASTSKALVAMPEWRFVIDEWMLARYLVVFQPPEEERGKTIWQGIRTMLPAQTLTVDGRGLHTDTFWKLDAETRGRSGSDEDWVDGFLHRFRAAVTSRLGDGSVVASTLSSGLDSGAVTALAAQELADRGRSVVAFTSVPLHPAEHLVPGTRTDEWPLAATVAARYPNITHVPVRSEATTPLGGIKRAVALHGVPLHAAANMFWMAEIYDETRRRGIDRLLTGQLGNGGVSWSGGSHRIFDLLARGHLLEGLEALRKWKGYNRTSWYRAVRRHILVPLLRPAWNRRHLLRRPGLAPWERYAAIHPAFAARLGLRDAMRAQGHDASFSRRMSAAEERWKTVWINGAMAGPIYHATALACGVRTLDPTADVRLLDFCFGVPDTEDVHGGGERMLVRRAMEGILPPDVQWTVVRGKQAADVSYRLRDHPDEMAAALETVAASPAAREYLDLASLEKAWADLQHSVTRESDQGASILLLRGLMAGFFLASVDQTPERG